MPAAVYMRLRGPSAVVMLVVMNTVRAASIAQPIVPTWAGCEQQEQQEQQEREQQHEQQQNNNNNKKKTSYTGRCVDCDTLKSSKASREKQRAAAATAAATAAAAAKLLQLRTMAKAGHIMTGRQKLCICQRGQSICWRLRPYNSRRPGGRCW